MSWRRFTSVEQKTTDNKEFDHHTSFNALIIFRTGVTLWRMINNQLKTSHL